MFDRNTVIKGLEKCISIVDCSPNDCPYYEHDGSGMCWDRLVSDALALIKEQKTDAKFIVDKEYVCHKTIGKCPSCGRVLDSQHDGNTGEHVTKFCYNCGQAVKWE